MCGDQRRKQVVGATRLASHERIHQRIAADHRRSGTLQPQVSVKLFAENALPSLRNPIAQKKTHPSMLKVGPCPT